MSSQTLQSNARIPDSLLWRSIFVDLAFWSVAGLIAAITAEPLAALTGLNADWFLSMGAIFALAGGGLIALLARRRPVPAALVQGFFIFNFVAAVVVWIVALAGWLPLTTAGAWGLAILGDVMLLLGIYQLYAWRRR